MQGFQFFHSFSTQGGLYYKRKRYDKYILSMESLFVICCAKIISFNLILFMNCKNANPHVFKHLYRLILVISLSIEKLKKCCIIIMINILHLYLFVLYQLVKFMIKSLNPCLMFFSRVTSMSKKGVLLCLNIYNVLLIMMYFISIYIIIKLLFYNV